MYIESLKKKLDEMEEENIKEFYRDYNLPEFNDDFLSIYLPRKGWGKFESEDYKKFERIILKEENYINYKDVKAEPDKYLMYLDYFMMNELIDLDQKQDSILFINSTTDPFNEEMVIQDKKLNAWLNKFGVIKTETIHSSGHVNVEDLISTLSTIQADNIIPVHTEHAETFTEFGLSGNIILPEKRKKYTF
jgi:ribonuclease J